MRWPLEQMMGLNIWLSLAGVLICASMLCPVFIHPGAREARANHPLVTPADDVLLLDVGADEARQQFGRWRPVVLYLLSGGELAPAEP